MRSHFEASLVSCFIREPHIYVFVSHTRSTIIYKSTVLSRIYDKCIGSHFSVDTHQLCGDHADIITMHVC